MSKSADGLYTHSNRKKISQSVYNTSIYTLVASILVPTVSGAAVSRSMSEDLIVPGPPNMLKDSKPFSQPLPLPL